MKTFCGYAIKHPTNDECWYVGDQSVHEKQPCVFVDRQEAEDFKGSAKHMTYWVVVPVQIVWDPSAQRDARKGGGRRKK